MAIKKYKPTTNGRRNMSVLLNPELSKNEPVKSLCVILKEKAGRNNTGHITVRHQGGGAKRKYRLIDFKRNKDNIKATVTSLEYDPNRSSNIALLTYQDGEKRYILAPKELKVGMEVISGDNVDIKVGNALPLKNIPVGTVIHNIEMYPGHGAQLVRSAGVGARIMGREGKYVLVVLPSTESRYILGNCKATIGEVGNEDHMNVNIGKAGRKRHMKIRPTVRGSVMNPNDHPHGGGEGRAPIGRTAPRTPWGKMARGVKTRDQKKKSNELIVRRRK